MPSTTTDIQTYDITEEQNKFYSNSPEQFNKNVTAWQKQQKIDEFEKNKPAPTESTSTLFGIQTTTKKWWEQDQNNPNIKCEKAATTISKQEEKKPPIPEPTAPGQYHQQEFKGPEVKLTSEVCVD